MASDDDAMRPAACRTALADETPDGETPDADGRYRLPKVTGAVLLAPAEDRPPCQQTDPDLFTDPVGLDEVGRPDYAIARRLCAGCPIRQACLDAAIAGHEPHGFWGGMAPDERERESARRLREDQAAG